MHSEIFSFTPSFMSTSAAIATNSHEYCVVKKSFCIEEMPSLIISALDRCKSSIQTCFYSHNRLKTVVAVDKEPALCSFVAPAAALRKCQASQHKIV